MALRAVAFGKNSNKQNLGVDVFTQLRNKTRKAR